MNDPYKHYAQMRATSPVRFNPDLRVWEVYAYRDIQAALADPVTFSSDISALQTMVTMDPPRHTQLRRLVARAFSAKLIAALEPRIAEITDELLARVRTQGRMDLMADLAFPLPITVIAELLGLPAEDRERFRAWSVPAIRAAEMELQGQLPTPELLATVAELTAYLDRMIDDREAAPREDLVSGLVHARVEGERLTREEINSTCRLLLIAGFETTTNLIGNVAQLLLTQPDALRQVQADPELLPAAVEETLRYQTPFKFFARKATRDVQLGGMPIRAGQQLILFNASGNRDESVFPEPERFDLHRGDEVRHLSFGHGIHYCLGAGLGRLEARIALNALFKLLPDVTLDAKDPAVPLQSIVLSGWQRLPAVFTPA